MCVDVKDFYLNNDMEIYKYIRIPVKMIPEEFVIAYNLTPLIRNGFLYVEVRKGMYGLPQARKSSKIVSPRSSNPGDMHLRLSPQDYGHTRLAQSTSR
eukprot:scaffold86274_cov53-Attheya_sp.AAC.3